LYYILDKNIFRRPNKMNEIDVKQVTLRCKDKAETLVFSRYDYNHDTDYEISIEDSYCGGDFKGLSGRFKRAWRAFFAKPIVYTSIYNDDKTEVISWLKHCLEVID
jgi:hypothetical protein